MPEAGWRPPVRHQRAEGAGAVVRFIEQTGSRERTYRFDGLGLSEAMAVWFAEVFAAAVGPRSGVTRVGSASNTFLALTKFARFLVQASPQLAGPEQLQAGHIKAYRLGFSTQKSRRSQLKTLRQALRERPGLPDAFRRELFEVALDKQVPAAPMPAYTDAEIQQIMTALRADIRSARDRIFRAREVLARYRDGRLDPSSADGLLARELDYVDRHGDLRRDASGTREEDYALVGGAARVISMLCLSGREAAAFCLLLAILTGENFSTVGQWPAAHVRPDGGTRAPAVALLEAVKARRGPEREHMITALEDLPPVLAGVLAGPDEEIRLFRSPLRIYLLLVDLAEVARRHTGSDRAFGFVTRNKPGLWTAGVDSLASQRWARAHGFPTGAQAARTPCDKPAINVRRIRQSVIEGGHQPIAHSRRTRDDRYLARSRTVQAESRTVVGDALREEVDKARRRQGLQILDLTALPGNDREHAVAARRTGLEPDMLTAVVTGRRDTVAAACVEPATEPGGQAPCRASFLDCLDCDNARALPRHLPVQIELRDQLLAQRPNLESTAWQIRFARRVSQLEDLIGHYTHAEQDQARRELTNGQRGLVEALVDGRLDLR
jgi:hypothetical protein